MNEPIKYFWKIYYPYNGLIFESKNQGSSKEDFEAYLKNVANSIGLKNSKHEKLNSNIVLGCGFICEDSYPLKNIKHFIITGKIYGSPDLEILELDYPIAWHNQKSRKK